MTDDLARLVLDAVGSVHEARTADEALAAIVGALDGRFGLGFAALLVFTEEGTMRVVARCGGASGFFEAGTEISVHLTKDIEALVGRLFLGETILYSPDSVDVGLLMGPLRDEGIAQGVVIPLTREGAVLGLLSLGCGSEGEIGAEERAALSGLGVAAEDRLLALAGI